MTPPMQDPRRAIELFAGPGGTSTALRDAGFTGTAIGLDNDRDACTTAVRAGHARIEADVTEFPIDLFTGVDLLLNSSPCQPFSRIGTGGGAADRQRVMDLIDVYATGGDADDVTWADDRSRLTAQPMRWIHALRPRWVFCEQVPDALPLWEHLGKRMTDLGYSVVTAVLNTEEYGVPQTRRRAVLIASRTTTPVIPAPTHERYRRGVERGGQLGLLPWVSMAEALGDGLDHRPSWTITGDATDYLADVVQRSNYSNGSAAPTATERGRTERTLDEPSVTVTGRPSSWEIRLRPEVRGTVAEIAEPRRSGTRGPEVIPADVARWRLSPAEAGVLQSFPRDYPWHGDTRASLYQQVGNAVPPAFGAAMLRQFVDEGNS